jgi:hypothetical protein
MHSSRERGRKEAVVTDPAGRVLFLGVLPAWGLPGLVDWYLHRRTQIDKPGHGGSRESAIHLLMLVEGFVPLALVVFAEVNPLVLVLMGGAALLHEATAYWYLSVATSSDREVGPAEQQVHSVRETVPFLLVVLAALHAWGRVRIRKGER